MMRRFALGVVTAVLVAASVSAQERIALTTPIAAKPAISNYEPAVLQINVNPPHIIVQLRATDGTLLDFVYPCSSPCAMDTDAKVATMIAALNTANLATRSLWRRVFDRLVLDFPAKFAGGATVK